jgi:hypothetical protein
MHAHVRQTPAMNTQAARRQRLALTPPQERQKQVHFLSEVKLAF